MLHPHYLAKIHFSTACISSRLIKFKYVGTQLLASISFAHSMFHDISLYMLYYLISLALSVCLSLALSFLFLTQRHSLFSLIHLPTIFIPTSFVS